MKYRSEQIHLVLELEVDLCRADPRIGGRGRQRRQQKVCRLKRVEVAATHTHDESAALDGGVGLDTRDARIVHILELELVRVEDLHVLVDFDLQARLEERCRTLLPALCASTTDPASQMRHPLVGVEGRRAAEDLVQMIVVVDVGRLWVIATVNERIRVRRIMVTMNRRHRHIDDLAQRRARDELNRELRSTGQVAPNDPQECAARFDPYKYCSNNILV